MQAFEDDLFGDLLGPKPKAPPATATANKSTVPSPQANGSNGTPSHTSPEPCPPQAPAFTAEQLKEVVSSAVNEALETSFGKFVKSLRMVLEDLGRRVNENSEALQELQGTLQEGVQSSSANAQARFTALDSSIKDVERGVQALRDKAELHEAQALLAKLAEGNTATKAHASAQPAPQPDPAPAPSPQAPPAASAPPVQQQPAVTPAPNPAPSVSAPAMQPQPQAYMQPQPSAPSPAPMQYAPQPGAPMHPSAPPPQVMTPHSTQPLEGYPQPQPQPHLQHQFSGAQAYAYSQGAPQHLGPFTAHPSPHPQHLLPQQQQPPETQPQPQQPQPQPQPQGPYQQAPMQMPMQAPAPAPSPTPAPSPMPMPNPYPQPGAMPAFSPASAPAAAPAPGPAPAPGHYPHMMQQHMGMPAMPMPMAMPGGPMGPTPHQLQGPPQQQSPMPAASPYPTSSMPGYPAPPVMHAQYPPGPAGYRPQGPGGLLPMQRMPSSSAPSAPGAAPGTGSRTVPLEHIIGDIVNMGFSRHQVTDVIGALQAAGQAVELNTIIDRLTNRRP